MRHIAADKMSTYAQDFQQQASSPCYICQTKEAEPFQAMIIISRTWASHSTEAKSCRRTARSFSDVALMAELSKRSKSAYSNAQPEPIAPPCQFGMSIIICSFVYIKTGYKATLPEDRKQERMSREGMLIDTLH